MAVMREAWTDERLDDLTIRMDRGFDRVDADLRDLKSEMATRFTAVDARFHAVDGRFQAIEARFQGVDTHFQSIDTRFQNVEARFDSMHRLIVATLASVVVCFLTILGGILTSHL